MHELAIQILHREMQLRHRHLTVEHDQLPQKTPMEKQDVARRKLEARTEIASLDASMTLLTENQ